MIMLKIFFSVIFNSSQKVRADFVKTIRQVTRDFLRGKASGGTINKYSYLRSKSYVGYGGKRLEALGRNKRTLRKTFSSSVSSGRSEASSLGSEERSSESGSLQDKSDIDRCDTDSVSTGKESADGLEGDKIFYRRQLSLELNSNSNNSVSEKSSDSDDLKSSTLTHENVSRKNDQGELQEENDSYKRPSLKGITKKWEEEKVLPQGNDNVFQ